MRYAWLLTGFALAATSVVAAQTKETFTLQQVLSAPFANQLTAAPVGSLFAWVEDAEGRHNLYVGGPNTPARALTHNTEDDGQDITQLAWAPDGSAIAYVYGAPTGADGKPANPAHLQRATPVQVMVQSLTPDAPPVVIGEGRAPLFTRDGRSLLFTREGQIWMAASTLPPATPPCPAGATVCDLPVNDRRFQGPRQLVFDRGSASSLTLSPDGSTLAFISRRREANEPSHSFLALYSITARTLSFPAPSTSDDSAPAFSPNGKQIAWIRNPFTDVPEFANPRTSATPWSIQLVDLSTNTARTVYSPEPNKPGSVIPDVTNGGPTLLWTADQRIIFYSEADGWVHLYAINTVSPLVATVLLTQGNFEVEDASLSHNSKVLIWSSNQATGDSLNTDHRHVWQLNLSSGEVETPKWRTSGSANEIHPLISADSNTIAFLRSDVLPMAPVLITTSGNQELREDDRSGTAWTSLLPPKQILFDSSDGLHLHSQLFLPKQEADSSAALRNDKGKRDGKGARGETATVRKHAALIFVHGGPKRQMLLGYPGMDYYSNAYAMNQYLTSRGFIVLSVNYRCGIGYGLEFRTCQQAGATGATEYNDVLAAQKYLASRPDVDAKRIGIWGGSYGGYLTALALARNSDLFAAGVDFHGVHDWNLEDNASDWKRGSFAQQDSIAAEALKSSPLADISKWHSPILLIHGDNDPSVAYAQTPLLADALRARNASLPKDRQVDVEELIFPDELHEFVLHKDWLAAYTAAAEFFERTLKP